MKTSSKKKSIYVILAINLVNLLFRKLELYFKSKISISSQQVSNPTFIRTILKFRETVKFVEKSSKKTTYQCDNLITQLAVSPPSSTNQDPKYPELISNKLGWIIYCESSISQIDVRLFECLQ